jgi:hypothetical protein
LRSKADLDECIVFYHQSFSATIYSLLTSER